MLRTRARISRRRGALDEWPRTAHTDSTDRSDSLCAHRLGWAARLRSRESATACSFARRAAPDRRGFAIFRVATFVALFVATIVGPESDANAWVRHGAWNSTWDPQFPVIPLHGCPAAGTNGFATWFPNTPWANIKANIDLATNEWFLGGGAHLRERVEADLSATDAQCTSGQPANGNVLLDAQQYNPGGNPWLAGTAWGIDVNGAVFTAVITLYAGTTNSGSYVPYNWATNADYPQANQYDFESVYLHELGHTLVLDHSSDSNAVMAPIAPGPGDVTKRILTDDDVQGLKAASTVPAYPATQLNMWNVWAPDWTPPAWELNQNGPLTNHSIGEPVACMDNDTPSNNYFGAFTTTSNQIHTFTWSSSGYADGVTIPASTDRPPSVACGANGRRFLGWIDRSTRYITYEVYSAGSWAGPYTLNYQSTIPPAVREHYDQDLGAVGFIMAFADLSTGKLRSLFSQDGISWTYLQNWDFIRTFTPAGWGCQIGQPNCAFSWADGNLHNTPQTWTPFYVNYFGPLVSQGGAWAIGTPPSDSYGGAVDYDSGGVLFFIWRTRDDHIASHDTVSFQTTVSAVQTQGAPNAVWAQSYQTISAWYCNNSIYNNL